jgi:hypothetical protein
MLRKVDEDHDKPDHMEQKGGAVRGAVSCAKPEVYCIENRVENHRTENYDFLCPNLLFNLILAEDKVGEDGGRRKD